MFEQGSVGFPCGKRAAVPDDVHIGPDHIQQDALFGQAQGLLLGTDRGDRPVEPGEIATAVEQGLRIAQGILVGIGP